jgi:hypothetical protein
MALFFFHRLVTSYAQTENTGGSEGDDMSRLTGKLLPIWLAAIAIGAVGAAPAEAAATRAEYIAQADPICAAAKPTIDQAFAVYNRQYKRWVHLAGHGTLKAWLRQTRRTAAALNRANQAEISLTAQLVAVPPAPGDEGTIGSWLAQRRQADSLGVAAATALKRIQVGKFFKLARRSDKAASAGVQIAQGIGFTVCDQVY